MAVNIGPRIGIDGEAEYRKQINNIIQQTKTLKSEFEKVASASEKETNALKKNAEERKILNQQIDAQKERIKKLSEMVEQSTQKYGEADTRTLKWKDALNQAETELNQLEAKLKAIPSSLQIVGDKMQEMGDKIQGIGTGIKNLGSALRPMSAAATAVIAGSVKTFADFESQMSRVKAISGATGEEFQALSDKAREMGASTKYTATESGEAFEYMAMAGWKAEQMLDGIEPVMNLAAASGEELATVSDIVTDSLTAFGLQAKDAAEFTDVLAATATNANTNVSMMGEAFKFAAPMAGAMGYSVQDVSLALGLMANNGIKADMAGTALRNMIQRMAKPTKESAEAMERLGVSIADDQGNMYSFRQIMDQLRKSFGNITMPIDEFNKQVDLLNSQLEDGSITEKKYEEGLEELTRQAYGAEGAEKARAAAMLAGSRAMPALLSIVNTAEGDYRKLATAIDNSSGAAQEMADIMLDNTAGAFTIMKSAVEGAGIELGEVFAPSVTKAANKVKDMANEFSNMSQSEQEIIAKQVAFVAAAAPALKIVGGMTEGLGKLVATGGQFVSWLGAVNGGPLALFVVGVGAAAAGIYALQKDIDQFRADSIGKALSSALQNEGGVPIDELFASISDKITELSGSFELVSEKSSALQGASKNVENLTAEIDKIKISMDAGVLSTEEGAAQIEDKIGGLADAISAKMTAASDVILAALGDGGALAQSLEKTGRGVEEMRKKVVESADDIQNEIADLQHTLETAQWGSDQWFEAYNRLMELGGGIDAVKESVDGFSKSIEDNPIDWSKYFNGNDFDLESFRNDLEATGESAAQFSQGMKTAMDETVAAAEELGNPELTAALKDAIPGAMAEGNAQIAEKALEAVNIMQNDMIGGIDEVITQAQEDWKTMSPWKKMFEFGGDEQSYVLSQVRVYKRDTVDPASAEIESMMNQLGVDGAGWASDAMGAIIEELFNIPTQAEYSAGATATLKSNWHEILDESTAVAKTEAEGYGKDVVDGLNAGIENNVGSTESTAQTWMERLKKAIHDSAMKFGSPSQTAKNFGKDTVDGYNQGIKQEQSTSRTTVNTWMGIIQSSISSKVPTITGLFADIKNGITTNMNTASDNVQSAMDKIKGIFNTKLEFPRIELPHFRISGEFSLNPPSVPSIDIDWYAKAMQGGMLLNGATIFGASGGNLLGGGEAGREWIVGETSLMSMIQHAVGAAVAASSNTITIGDTTIIVNAPEGANVEEIADMVEDRMNMRYQRVQTVWAH